MRQKNPGDNWDLVHEATSSLRFLTTPNFNEEVRQIERKCPIRASEFAIDWLLNEHLTIRGKDIRGR